MHALDRFEQDYRRKLQEDDKTNVAQRGELQFKFHFACVSCLIGPYYWSGKYFRERSSSILCLILLLFPPGLVKPKNMGTGEVFYSETNKTQNHSNIVWCSIWNLLIFMLCSTSLVDAEIYLNYIVLVWQIPLSWKIILKFIARDWFECVDPFFEKLFMVHFGLVCAQNDIDIW